MKYQRVIVCAVLEGFSDTPISRSFFLSYKIEVALNQMQPPAKKMNRCISFPLMLMIIFHMFRGSSKRGSRNADSEGEEKHHAGGCCH